ncbi:MAG: 2-hydroxyacyl-CoA dehydratase [Phycisphaeraceae bacterium]
MTGPARIDLAGWDARYRELAADLREPAAYAGPLRRHVDEGGDLRLLTLLFDNSAASHRLWNFLLSEEDRLHAARTAGSRIVGTMKDLGTVPVLAYAWPELVAFYPDGAWWTPCVMELSDGLLGIADQMGLDESFCPVRAMVGAFVTENHFPVPDLLICSAGAVCDDFSAIAQRLAGLGYPILWWEMPVRRPPDPGEPAATLPTGFTAPAEQVEIVRTELARLRDALADLAGRELAPDALAESIRRANRFRATLAELRRLVFTAPAAPLPALEMLITEMLAIHFCSDPAEAQLVVDDLLAEVRRRVEAGQGVLDPAAARLFWVNPVADMQVMNLLETCGGRLCGSDFLLGHALEPIDENLPPLDALARCALGDPMVGSSADRAERVVRDAEAFGAEGVVVSRIPGASHCAFEGEVIASAVRERLDLPVLEIEVPPLAEPVRPALRSRLEALVETVHSRREA